jgi:hypothetical protein
VPGVRPSRRLPCPVGGPRGLDTTSGCRSLRDRTEDVIGGGVAGTFTKGGLGVAGIATNLGGEAVNYAIC